MHQSSFLPLSDVGVIVLEGTPGIFVVPWHGSLTYEFFLWERELL
jgi:hypothetical protein